MEILETLLAKEKILYKWRVMGSMGLFEKVGQNVAQ